MKTIEQQTGWKRPFPKMICQDLYVLEKVVEYDFDLEDAGFQAYAQARGVLHVAGVQNSIRWDFTKSFELGLADFLENTYFHYAKEHNGARYKYTEAEMHLHYEIMCIARAKLQDAWELYQNTVVKKVAA